MLRIGIDAGHGMGNTTWGRFDPGAVNAGVREADINLFIALLLQDECRRRGWSTVMTRTDNTTNANLRYRVGKFRSMGCDAIVSIHCNAAEDRRANGVETLYLNQPWVAEAVQRQLVAATGLRDRGAKRRTDLAILRYERPSILVETAFITNANERRMLIDPVFQQQVARAIADGLAETVRR